MDILLVEVYVGSVGHGIQWDIHSELGMIVYSHICAMYRVLRDIQFTVSH